MGIVVGIQEKRCDHGRQYQAFDHQVSEHSRVEDWLLWIARLAGINILLFRFSYKSG